jgi:hypothetical protein
MKGLLSLIPLPPLKAPESQNEYLTTVKALVSPVKILVSGVAAYSGISSVAASCGMLLVYAALCYQGVQP